MRYFWQGLKPFILAELKYQNLELKSFDQKIKKLFVAEAKAAL